MKKLYPLKFKPIPQYKIWGGHKLNSILPKENQIENLGEIWSLSGVTGNVSEVENGELKGKSLNEIISAFKEKLVGKKVFKKFGNEFPLLIKFIDAAQPLSVQVHPNDEIAKKRHNSFGKSEMWYIMEAEKNAELIIGFKENVTQSDYENHLKNNSIEHILNRIPVDKGDAVYLPSGRVHAIGAGILLAEIQQTSDVTYRIYDYNRIDKDGKKRELHTDLALDAIDFNPIDEIKINYNALENQFNNVINTPYFTTKLFQGSESVSIQNNEEMLIYICTEGKFNFIANNNLTELNSFETLLVPAETSEFVIQPLENAAIIEVKVP